MKVSVAMASYNGSRYLQPQLDSFVTQTRQPDELVICDDCSSDETLDILRKFQARAPFPVFIHSNNSNQGFIKNFEKALSFCSGDIIFLSDQDDVWLENKIAEVESVFADFPAVMVVINDSFITDEFCEKRISTKLSNVKSNKLREDAYVAGCATAVRAEFLQLALPFPLSPICSHDLWINKLAILSGVRMVLPKPLQLYRRHGGNVTIHSVGANKRVFFPALAALNNFGIRDCSAEWQAEIVANKVFIDRLIKFKSTDIFDYAGLQIDREINNLSRLNLAIENRICLLKYSKIQRIPRVIKFLLSGFYSQFQGWKSAVKDVLR